MSRAVKIGIACLAVVAIWAGRLALHRPTVSAAPTEADWASQRLRMYETARRASADFAHLPGWNRESGPDPYVVRSVPDSSQLVGILRGSDALVVLDANLGEVQRLPAPASPSGLAVADDGTVFVAGELSSTIARFRWEGPKLRAAGSYTMDGVRALRDVATGPDAWVYLVEEHEGQLVAFRLDQHHQVTRLTKRKLGNGPVRIARVGDLLIIDYLLDHALVLQKLEPTGALSAEEPLRIVHDGPIWSFSAAEVGDDLIIAAGGVEDHPLDRRVGAFGYIDSFLYVYRARKGGPPVREATINLSELGVVTPKAILLQVVPRLSVVVAGYGSDKLLEIELGSVEGRLIEGAVTATELLPGSTSVVLLTGGELVFADPLLDAWLVKSPHEKVRTLPIEGSTLVADRQVRLGEALFFTTLMAPHNRADGPLSRFTCETCHYEGYVDGRTHHTGRDEVHAVTKPLLGLFNNRPYFSRALDPDLMTVAFNEFRVAGARSGHDPWFALSVPETSWLSYWQVEPSDLSPESLRKALMSFLMAFNHRPNPMVQGRTRWSAEERQGASLFREHCESCHQARLASDQPDSRIPFEHWEETVMAPEGALVWGRDAYAKTGVLPYVHEDGARVPSLRRLYKKRPYFTNGSAKDLASLLERARFSADSFWHEPPPAGDQLVGAAARLDEPERAALLAFLDLL